VKNIERLSGIDTAMYYMPPVVISEGDDEIYKAFPFLKSRFNEITMKLINQEVSFTLNHKSYQELYTFTRENEVCSVGLSYNKKGFNDYVQEIRKVGEKLPDFVKNVVLKRYLHPVALQATTDYQKDLYDLISEKISELDIHLTNIIHPQNCERYYFKTDADCAYIDFWYDGKGIYTKFIPKSTLGEADEKLQKLLSNIT